MQPCVVSTREVMLALKVAIAVGGCLGGVLSKAANAMFQPNNSSHQITWSSSVFLACFLHNLYKLSNRRINSDQQHLYMSKWHSGDVQSNLENPRKEMGRHWSNWRKSV